MQCHRQIITHTHRYTTHIHTHNRVKNGERVMSSFRDLIIPVVNSSDNTLDSLRTNITLPRQPGVFPQPVNTNGSARATATFAIGDEVYTAVCVSEADGVSLGGGVDVTRWNNGTFEIVQARTDDPSASAVSSFKAVDSKGQSHSYIAVANSLHDKLRTVSSTYTALRVYRYVCVYVCMSWCACWLRRMHTRWCVVCMCIFMCVVRLAAY